MIELTTPFGVFLGDLFCPLCGSRVLSQEGDDLPPCPHLQFIYLGEIDDFFFVTPSIEEAIDRIYEEKWNDADDEDAVIEIDRLALADSLLPEKLGMTMVFHSSGMACGPVHSTVALGFAFRLDQARSQADILRTFREAEE